MYLIGIAIFLLGIYVLAYSGDMTLAQLIDLPTLIMHLFMIVGVLTAVNGFTAFWSGLKAAVLPKSAISEEMRGRAASLFRLLSKTAALSSLIGLIVGVLWMFGVLDDPYALGGPLSVCLIAPLYGIILIVAVFEPVVFILKKRQNPERQPKTKD